MKIFKHDDGGIIYTPYITTASMSPTSGSAPEFHSVNPDHMYIPFTSSSSQGTSFDSDEVIPVSVQPEFFSSGDEVEDYIPSELETARTILTARTGGHQFKTADIQVGEMQGFLDVLAKNGIYVRVTSGIRPGAVTSSGNRSRHDDGHAIDITPIEGETWEDLVNKIRNCPEVLAYMVTHNVGWLEEISAEDQKKYNATGANIHVSIAGKRGYGEASAINGRKKTFGV